MTVSIKSRPVTSRDGGWSRSTSDAEITYSDADNGTIIIKGNTLGGRDTRSNDNHVLVSAPTTSFDEIATAMVRANPNRAFAAFNRAMAEHFEGLVEGDPS